MREEEDFVNSLSAGGFEGFEGFEAEAEDQPPAKRFRIAEGGA